MAVLELQENGKLQEMPSTIPNVSSNNQSGNFIAPNDNGKIISWPLYIIFQILGLLLILSVFLWLQIFRGGYDISDTRKICNWHPLLMTIAFIFLFANSILHFRNFHHVTKRTSKIQHTIIFSCIVILGSFGLWAGLKSNTIAVPPVPQFYTLHSWLGILTCAIFVLQFVCGFVSFLFPGVARRYKETLMTYHVFFGTTTFALSVTTSVVGFSEKNIFALDKQAERGTMSIEGLFVNIVGLTLIFYGVLVVYLLINPEYKRPLESERIPVIIHNHAFN